MEVMKIKDKTKEINLKIDGIEVNAIEGTSILDAANKIGIEIRLIKIEHPIIINYIYS